MVSNWFLKLILSTDMANLPETDDYFTKHLFGAGLECPTKLYYKSKSYPEREEAIPFIRHAVFNKRLLKALARSVYADGFFIDNNSIPRAVSQTKELLQQKEAVLFDTVFEYRQMMGRLPIVIKKGDKLTIFQFQTKAFDSRRYNLTNTEGQLHSKWRSYLLDFAYQLYLVKQNYPEFDIQPLLVMPEKTGKAYTDNLPFLLKPLKKEIPVSVSASNQELLVKLDVKEQVRTIWDDHSFARQHLPEKTFEDSVFYLRNLYLNEEREEPEIGLKCRRCEFRIKNKEAKSGFDNCWNPHMETDNPSGYHVFDLIGSGINRWMENGIYDQREISPVDVLAPESIAEGEGRITQQMRQALQVCKANEKEVPEEIIRSELFDELNRWQYPLHFLDFEAGNYAVPARRGRSPYHLLVFQFSCHSLHENGDWNHHQWIDEKNSGYPNYELIRQLMNVPDIEQGTIVQYSDFERNALKQIRREIIDERDEITDADQLANWIERIISRNDSSHRKPPYIADLSRQVKHFYYNSEMESSLSIKDVLKSVMSHSEYLKQIYSQPYRSNNFENFTWWQPDGKGGARNPYILLTEKGDSPIRRGAEAMVVYGKLIAQDLDAERLKAYQNALLKYCELDTLAMMMIYQHWKRKMAE